MATENEKRIDELKADLVQKALAYGIANATFDRVWQETYRPGQKTPPLAEMACHFRAVAIETLGVAAKELHDEMLRQAKEEVAAEQPHEAKKLHSVDEVGF